MTGTTGTVIKGHNYVLIKQYGLKFRPKRIKEVLLPSKKEYNGI